MYGKVGHYSCRHRLLLRRMTLLACLKQLAFKHHPVLSKKWIHSAGRGEQGREPCTREESSFS